MNFIDGWNQIVAHIRAVSPWRRHSSWQVAWWLENLAQTEYQRGQKAAATHFHKSGNIENRGQ